VELLLAFSLEPEDLLSVVPELVPESLDEDPLAEVFDFWADSRLSVR
jgi:hypothetical protein